MLEEGSALLFERCPRGLDRRLLRAFLRRLQAEVAEGQGFVCLLTRDARLRRLNREFLGKDEPTDVLSFPEPDGGSLGEIAISMDRAAAQAAAFGHSLEEEVMVLMLHGLLHLRGMDHETDNGQMARAETRWRKKLGLPHGLIARATR